ncbi:MoaD/ThiS family protein [Halalkalibaculum sp. DA384]|uniref:MoaD/ThiS family protein n=1 Tax=Halalkalibaculum sp. DA384 TaxID=3373606 RepID=UPI003754A143
MAKIIIPTPLRKFTDQNRSFITTEDTLSGAIQQLIEEYPDVKSNLLDDDGNVRSFIKVYIGDDEVDPNENGSVELAKDTEISIVPAIAGGC